MQFFAFDHWVEEEGMHCAREKTQTMLLNVHHIVSIKPVYVDGNEIGTEIQTVGGAKIFAKPSMNDFRLWIVQSRRS